MCLDHLIHYQSMDSRSSWPHEIDDSDDGDYDDDDDKLVVVIVFLIVVGVVVEMKWKGISTWIVVIVSNHP